MFKRVLFIASLLFCISFSVKAVSLTPYIHTVVSGTYCTYTVFNFQDSSAYVGTHKASLKDNWYYSDGTTDTGKSVTKYFTTTGTYTIKLVVTDAADGLKDSVTKTITISNVGVLPGISWTGSTCARSEPLFSLTSSTTVPGIEYSTYYGDLTLPVQGTVLGNHTFATNGVFKIQVRDSISTTGCKSNITVPITIGQRPFARTPKVAAYHCQDSSTLFTATQISAADTQGMRVTYLWRFVDKTTYTGKSVNKLFKYGGDSNVEFIVINHTGTCSDSQSVQYEVYSNPAVNFGMVPHCQDSLGIIYDSTTISITSNNHPTNWTWNFCDSNHANCDTTDGYTGFGAPASFTYGFPHGGTFYVTEYVISGDGCRDSLQKKVYVSPTPTPNFAFQNTCVDSAVQFMDASTVPKGNSIVSWKWSFDDGNSATTQNPTNEYAKPGYHYSVRLIPKTQAGCIDSIRENVVVYQLPAADFVFKSQCQGVQISFLNNSSIDTSHGNSLSHYVWLYGDGTKNDTVPNTLHAFKDSGYHNVKLVAFSNHGCSDTITHEVYVYPLPKPSFVLANDCERDSVKFINTSTSTFGLLTDSSFNWDFGDSGVAQFIANPNHLYRYPDVFNVKVIAITRVYGCEKDTTIPVTIIPGPHSNDSIGAKCTGAPITFYNRTTSKNAGVIKYIWKFGDGTSDTSSSQNPNNVVHTYNGTANYHVELISYMPATGCSDSIRIPVPVTPRPVVFFRANSACQDSLVTCTDSSYVPGYTRPQQLLSWAWDFGDGKFASGPNVTHKYAAPGVYTIREYVTSNSECEDSFIRQVTIYRVPVSNFSYVESCAGTATPFTNLTTAADSVVQSIWVFSSDSTMNDTAQNASHIYQDNDILQAALIVTTANGCPNTKNEGIAIFTSPVSQFQPLLNCNNRPVGFNAANNGVIQPPNYITSYHWDFGDPNDSASTSLDTSDVQDPSPIYFSKPGKYVISLTETSNQGCVNTDTEVVTIPELPIAGFSYNGNCVGRQYVFVDTTKVKGGFGEWDFGDNSAVVDGSFQSHIYTQSGTYPVKLYEIITYPGNINCTSDTDERNIVVNPLPYPKFVTDTSCFGQPTPFYDSSKANGGVISSYSWKFGDNTIDSTNKSFFYHVYKDSFQGSSFIYNAVLKITTNFGCDSADTQKVFIRQIPYASFTPSPDPAVIQQPQVTFTNTTQNADPNHYYWTFGDSTDSHEISPTHTYKDTGTYTVTLATDNDYCQDTFRYIVYVTPGYTLYAPNCITVNGDGKNDVWMAKGVGVVDFDCYIVDRWGQQVFHSTNIDQPWNADYNGNGVKVPEGVYVYTIKGGDFSGTNFTSLKGTITVVR